MNLQTELLRDFSKAQAEKIASYIGNNQQLFAGLMHHFLNGSYPLMQRASWVVSKCIDNYPELFMLYLPNIIENLKNSMPDAVKRNIVRILQYVEIPEELSGTAATICFDLLSSKKEPVAVKVFAMTVLANIAKKEPALQNELKLTIEEQLPFAQPAFVSRGQKTLQQLRKNQVSTPK